MKRPTSFFWSAATRFPLRTARFPVILKIVFDEAGKLLGAQAIGREGADKRIDVLSTAMLFGANVRDLTKLDLCYSPQTGSAKDPIHAAAFVAENVLNGLVRFIEPGEVADLFAGRYRGIRPAFGYPSCPDHSLKTELFELLDVTKAIGATLTESYMMSPGESTCGLRFAHPHARNFSDGTIDDEQLNDYARRRGIDPEKLRTIIPQHLLDK